MNNRNLQAALFILGFFVFAALAAYTDELILLLLPIAVVLIYLGWQNIQTVFFLLLFFLPLSIEYGISQTLTLDLPDELLMIFLAFCTIACWLYDPKVFLRKTLNHPIILLLLFYFCWLFIPVIFSTQPLVSVKYLLAKSWYILAFVFAPLIFFQNPLNIKKGIQFLVFSMVCVVLIIFIRHAGLGFRFAAVNEAVSPFFRNHVNYSAMLVCSLPILGAVYWLDKHARKRWWSVLIIIFLVALYFSYSRGAWLALGAGIIAYWLIKKKLIITIFIVSMLAALLVLFWLGVNDNYLRFAPNYNKTVFHPFFGQHIRATYQLQDISTAERFHRWVAGIRMAKENPLTGFGPNSFYYHYKEYALPAFKTWVSGNPERSTVHNYFLLLAIEQGIPGLLLFLILIGALLYYAQYLYHRLQDVFYRTLVLTTGVILVMILVLNFLSDLIETDKIGSLFFLCIPVLVITDINTRNKLHA